MRAVLWRYTPILLIALAWEASARFGLVSELVLPALSKIGAAFIYLLSDDLPSHTLQSLKRGAIGLGMAIAFGTTAGVMMAWNKTIRILVNPLIRCFYPMPKSALIPVIIMWLGLGDTAQIALIFIGCTVPIVVSSFNSSLGVDNALLWSARSMGATERQVLMEIVIPASLPGILNGIRTALALAFILMISSEMIISRNGIGYLISILGEGGDYEGMFAGVVVVAALGFLADRLYMMGTRRLLVWME